MREMIFNVPKVTRYIRSVIQELRDGELFFSHTQFDLLCFIFVFSVPSRIKIRYLNIERQYPVVEKTEVNIRYVKYAVVRSLLSRFYPIDLVVKKIGEVYVLGLDEKNIIHIGSGITLFDAKETFREQIGEVIKSVTIPSINVDSVWIHQGLERFIDAVDLKSFYDQLNEIDFAVKLHPGASHDEGEQLFRNKQQLPKHIPIELLSNSVNKNIMSVSSQALVLMSKYFHGNVISLIDMVQWKDLEYKRVQKELLLHNTEGKILFPQNINELKNILK